MGSSDLDSPPASDVAEKHNGHAEVLECPSGIDDKALVRRIDLKVLPMLFVVYIVAFLDRVNISNALTMDLPEDLGMTGNQPNIALVIFFVPYVLFEIPSNVVLKKLKPHIWLSVCIFSFGIAMLAQGFVQNFGGLCATRFVLGLAEAGVFPGSFYLISFWYKREEAQKRFTFYWCSVLIASAFGGLLASGIAKMDGVRGLANWRWIFILEGIATILVGFVAFFCIADFPDESKWLTEEEKQWIRKKTGRDVEQNDSVTFKDVVVFFSDFKNILGGIIYFSMVVPIYSFAYFAPTIIKGLGYSVVQTQLHTVPPVAASLALAAILAYASDKINHRSSFVFGSFAVTLVGLAVLYKVHNYFSVQYMAIHFTAMGAFAGGPIVVCWYVMNKEGHVQRGIGTAWIIGFGNIGGVVAVFAFLAKDGPKFETGYSAVLAVVIIGLVASLVYAFELMRLNKKLSRSGTDYWRYAL